MKLGKHSHVLIFYTITLIKGSLTLIMIGKLIKHLIWDTLHIIFHKLSSANTNVRSTFGPYLNV